MSLFFQRGLVFLYAFLIITFFMLLLVLSGVYISCFAGGLITTLWLLCCYFSGWVMASPGLFFHCPCRRPLREEEERLRACLGEVLQRADCSLAIRLRITDGERVPGVRLRIRDGVDRNVADRTPEVRLRNGDSGEPGVVAAGHHTMVFSRRALKELDDEELKGLMAQALGHLLCKNGIVYSAMVTASQLPLLVRSVFFRAWPILLKGFRASWVIATGISILFGFVLLMGLYYFMQGKAILLPILSVIVFVFLFTILDRLFFFFYRMAARFGEYRQDAYAHRLGFGAGLCRALQKAATAGGQATIYNRIRRLEALD